MFIDYGDVINAMVDVYGPDVNDEYFYFFEECQDKGLLDGVTDWEVANSIVVEAYDWKLASEC